MKRLTLERQLRGWTQTELARQAGVSNMHLSRLEGGRHTSFDKTAVAIADALEWKGESKDLLQDIKRGDAV